MTKTTRAALFVEVEGKMHQALMTPQEMSILVDLAATFHGGMLKVNVDPIETIAFAMAK